MANGSTSPVAAVARQPIAKPPDALAGSLQRLDDVGDIGELLIDRSKLGVKRRKTLRKLLADLLKMCVERVDRLALARELGLERLGRLAYAAQFRLQRPSQLVELAVGAFEGLSQAVYVIADRAEGLAELTDVIAHPVDKVDRVVESRRKRVDPPMQIVGQHPDRLRSIRDAAQVVERPQDEPGREQKVDRRGHLTSLPVLALGDTLLRASRRGEQTVAQPSARSPCRGSAGLPFPTKGGEQSDDEDPKTRISAPISKELASGTV